MDGRKACGYIVQDISRAAPDSPMPPCPGRKPIRRQGDPDEALYPAQASTCIFSVDLLICS